MKKEKEVKRKRSNMITRRIITGKVVDVYKFENGTITLIERTTVSKVNEKELAKKYEVNKVMVDVIEEVKEVYGVPVDEFMKMAVKVED